MKKKNVKAIFFLIFVFVTVFIWSNSAKSAAESTKQSGFFVDFFLKNGIIKDLDKVTVIVRKLAHFTEFFVQGAALSVCLFENFGKRCIYVLFAGLFTATTDEFIQMFFDGRGSLVSDVFIDFSGTVCCVLIFMVLRCLLRKR